MNTITIELGEDTRKLLSHIDGTLTELLREVRVVSDTAELIRLAVAEGKIPATLESTEEPETVAPWTAPSADIYDEDGGEIAPEPEKAVITLADIQKKVVGLSTAGKKDAVKAIVQEYAPKVSAIPEDKFAEVLEKLAGLEG